MGGRCFLLSVSMGDWPGFHTAFRAFRAAHTDPPWLTALLPEVVREGQGELVVLDWAAQRVLARRRLPMPQGVCVEPGRLLVALRGTHEIALLTPGGERRISHPWLANLHTIERVPGGEEAWLVTSSATDIIAELDAAGRVRWSWRAFEHGFDALPGGAPYRFDPARDHRLYTGVAADHAAHVNSAIFLDEATILATFFHQGVLVRIDRGSGRCEVVLDGLRHPHSVRARPGGGYLLCDSLGSRVLLLDAALAVVGVLGEGLMWVQDAIEVELGGVRRVLALSNVDIAAGGLEGANTILEIDPVSGALLGRMDMGRERHLFALEPLDDEEAARWVEAWGGAEGGA